LPDTTHIYVNTYIAFRAALHAIYVLCPAGSSAGDERAVGVARGSGACYIRLYYTCVVSCRLLCRRRDECT
jgi:hypothetical protein